MPEQPSGSTSRCFKATDAEGGRRLDELLAARVSDLSRMRIANLIAAGESTVNGEVAQAGLRVKAGDSIVLVVAAGSAATAMSPDDIPLEILFEDEHLLVLVKPAGMLVHPTLSVKRGTLANALAHHLNNGFGSRVPGSGLEDSKTQEPETRNPEPIASDRTEPYVRPGMVHRLDRATSGLMVIAKTQRALSVLSRHFHKRLVEKRYLALVRGNVIADNGSIIAPIGRDEDRRPRWWVMESGRSAETRFQVRERLEDSTLLELQPITGRTNQLRIHCAYYGHPILGDELYEAVAGGWEAVAGGRWPVAREEGERVAHGLWPAAEENGYFREGANSLTASHHRPPTTDHRPPVPGHLVSARLCLHASSLAFHHPASGEWREFTSPLPEDFSSVLNLIRSRG